MMNETLRILQVLAGRKYRVVYLVALDAGVVTATMASFLYILYCSEITSFLLMLLL